MEIKKTLATNALIRKGYFCISHSICHTLLWTVFHLSQPTTLSTSVISQPHFLPPLTKRSMTYIPRSVQTICVLGNKINDPLIKSL